MRGHVIGGGRTPPTKVAGGLRVGIPKAVAEITDLRAVNFARQHHYERGEKRKRCVLCRELGLKIGLEGPEAHIGHINADKAGKWRGTNTQGRWVQCNVALCTEGHCFKYYHELKKLS
jgi:hypothetical protein